MCIFQPLSQWACRKLAVSFGDGNNCLWIWVSWCFTPNHPLNMSDLHPSVQHSQGIAFLSDLIITWLVGTGTNKQRQHILKLADILVTSKSITFVTLLLLSSWLVGTGTNKQRQYILKLANIGYKQTGWHHWLQANWLTSLVTSKSITLVTSFLLSSGQIHGSLHRLGINWRMFTFQSPIDSELSLTWKENTDPDK